MKTILGFIKNGAIAVTVNNRLARRVSRAYDSLMKNEGAKAWETPLVLPLSSFAARLREESRPDKPLLSGTRAGALWGRIVEEDGLKGPALLNPEGVASTSFEAYSLLKEYGIRLPADDIYLTDEARALKRWAAIYDAEVERLGFIEASSLFDEVMKFLRTGRVKPPERIVIAGFDEFTPAESRLMAALKGAGSDLVFWPGDDTSPKGAVTIRPMEDEESEAIEAARWIRRLPEDSTVGVIAPDLRKYRGVIVREFAAELNPPSVLPGSEVHEVFNISLGLPLYNDPLVKSALDVLSIGLKDEDLYKLSSVILSPYFASSMEERLSFASIDAALKKENRLKASLFDLRTRLERGGRPTARVERWITALRSHQSKDRPSKWALLFGSQLKETWLKGVKLSSAEHQSLEALNKLLEELSTLDEVLGQMTFKEAASRLKRLASATIHQGEVPDCRVEVMGLLESAGLKFDHIWLMGADEFSLPKAPAPNPFIPLFIQKEHNLPLSSHERELEFARRTLERVLRSAPFIQASFPKVMDDKECDVSPLLKGLGEADGSVIASSARLKDIVRSTGGAEAYEDPELIPVDNAELETLSGGTAVIKDHSICPFRAFAVHRLKAAEVPETELGIAPMKRGSILHEAMRAFWERLKSSDGLKTAIDKRELEQVVREVSLEAIKGVDVAPLSEKFLDMERQRLEALLLDWAKVEAKRPAFRVKAVEQETEFVLSGLKLKGRIDRIDDSGGDDVVVDYKTGTVNKSDWATTRPLDPQLLIYSMAGRCGAVAFARLLPGECRFVGVSSSDNILPGVKGFDKDSLRAKAWPDKDWEGLMEFWKTVIEDLARGFVSGVVAVDPNPGANGKADPCKRCEVSALCRIAEFGPPRGNGEENDVEGENDGE
ncbi:MAG: PD-(D/E)XK nuclease family protein [Deltaproteobacteria bacterium]|nr:PD-(D/E)XK nuclease family protein [Deltaproteobacteria bacterium]